jgi:adenylate cyclase
LSIFKSRKFRIDILTIFITLFLISILGITYYFYSRSNDAILKVANGFISRTIDSITQKMDEFLQPTPLFSIANLIMNDLKLDQADMTALSSYMHVVLKSYPQLVNAYIADTNGNLFIENRVTGQPLADQFIPFIDKSTIPVNTSFVSGMLTPSKSAASLRFVYKNKTGAVIKTGNASLIDFDPRTRPWFTSAKASGKSMWIGVYPFYDMPMQVVTIAFPIYVNNHFMGVAAADLAVDSIRDAMKKFSIDAKGVVFIANHHGQVIAYQDNQMITGDESDISTVYTTKNPLIKKAYEIYLKSDADNFTFMLDGVAYIAHFKTYAISGREEWEIAAVIPMDVFVGSIREVNRNALIFSLITLVIGLGLVVLSSNKISKPIIQLAEETSDMQHFNFTKSTTLKSHIYEVQTMVNAVNVAKAALNSFSKYVPRLLVEQLLKLGTIAELGGEKRSITVLFTDIKGFTEMSEKIEPNLLMLQLSDYLNTLTQCIHRHHGNIDKYIGDSVMAFWGVPHEDSNQVFHACLALLACQREVHRMCHEAQLVGLPVFITRFGLNTGTAIVGNLGSSDRLNYTAIGDTVNLASRLEAINKDYNTEIIVSDAVYAACKDQFIFRPIDLVNVKGKVEPVRIFELIAENRTGKYFAATPEQQELASMFTEAYHLYHSKQYQAAQVLFTNISHQFPTDTVTQLYIERCGKLLLRH